MTPPAPTRPPAAFTALPLRFDAARMAEEAAALPESAWRPGTGGPSPARAVALVSAYGDPANGETRGPMLPTPWLRACPYLRQVLASLDVVVGRARLVRGGGGAAAGGDASYYAVQRLRIEIPVAPSAELHVRGPGGCVRMAPGEAWVVDTWHPHQVAGPSPAERIWLAVDTVGSPTLWERLEDPAAEARSIPWAAGEEPALHTEVVNAPAVMSPGEQESLAAVLLANLPDGAHARALRERLTRFMRVWRALWSLHGERSDGWPAYAEVRDELGRALEPLEGTVRLANGVDAVEAVRGMILAPALDPDRAQAPGPAAPAAAAAGKRARAAAADGPPAAPDGSAKEEDDAFRSVSTNTFAELLHLLRVSLAVTTYQSGRVVLVRAEDASTLNTHLRRFETPMGVAVTQSSLVLGTRNQVRFFRNDRELASGVEPAGRHDACFIPSASHVTGDIRIHELAFAGDELWLVNTRFSALCTLEEGSSFVPRWQPPFITALAPEDRCHLNGMAVVDGRVRYVSALGVANTDNGWRDRRASGGVILDVDTGETIVRGLSMPHSPRWYDGRLWLLESGRGTLATADLATGRVETVAELPGFARGLAFAGPFAFVGLSQVRETNIFGGLPLAERVPRRECGVWVVDIRSGRIVAFLRFEGVVQEIFDVQVLPARFPELLDMSSPLLNTSYVIPSVELAAAA